MKTLRMRQRGDSLIGQVVAANVVLVTLTLFAASVVAGLDLSVSDQRWQFIVLGLVILLTFCVNIWMLQRRFGPLEHLIDRIERIDPAEPGTFSTGAATPPRRSTAWRSPSSGCCSAWTTSAGAPASSCCAPRRRSAAAWRATSTTR